MAAIVGDPVIAMATAIPVMGVTAIPSWLWWRCRSRGS
jgi:hypothetical protein